MSNSFINPFVSDEIRNLLSQKKEYKQLLMSYDGSFNDINNISTAILWDFKSKVMLKTFKEKEIRLSYVDKYLDKLKTVLDFGVGNGEVYNFFEIMGKGKNYTGIDFSREIVIKLQKLYADGNFVVGSLDSIGGQFDQICALEVFEHISAPCLPTYLLKINKMLKSEGTLICSVPTYEALKFNVLCCPNCGSLVHKEGHCRSYTPELINAELFLSGFEACDQELVFPIGEDFFHRLYFKVMRMLNKLKPVNIVIKAKKVTDEPEFKIYS